MKKILIFSESFEPAYKGGGVPQSLVNLVKSLSNIFRFYVITLNHEYRAPKELLEGIETNQWTDVYNKGKVIYLTRETIGFQKIKNLIHSIQPDIIYLNGFHEFYFVIAPLYLAKQMNINVVMAPRGLLHPGALAIKPFKKKMYLELFKMANMHNKIRWHATDHQEILDVKKTFGQKAEVILANDTPDLTTYPITPIIKKSKSLKLVTISLLAPKKNHLLVLKLLSELNFLIEYDIYGHIYDQDYWLTCQNLIATLPSNIKVNYRGGIKPKEAYSILSRYHFFIMPTFGENFGHVIFESLNAGRPVIISDKTPWRNLENFGSGWDIPLERPDLLKEAIIEAFEMEQKQFDSLAEGAQKMAQRYIKESTFTEDYNTLFISND
ncbi:glycosyltransferase [Rhodocytophaga rosea]|uniref:Glycosyltransferase n=1 Tax=Rhodocytophaga rosea TaxID=2704465 RepID=A0A6C0GD32_9BACT|nr:glycosyltransferase [Rhodocytophaga rosea]QHT65764.1 glycosyltransferase [Rhodocytophaga rosea]